MLLLPFLPSSPEVIVTQSITYEVVQSVYFTNAQDVYFHIQLGPIWMMAFEVCSVTYTDFHNGSATFETYFGIIFLCMCDSFACVELWKNDIF